MVGIFRSFAVLPAAGQSRRMGRAKLLLPWRGETVIETVLAAWRASSIERIVVVVSPGDVALAKPIRGERVDLVIPQAPPPDMKASVLYALEHIEHKYRPQTNDAWLLAPADLPNLPAAVIEQVLRQYEPMAPSIIVPTLQGQRGHPVLFPWSLVSEARQLGPDEGLNALVSGNSCKPCPCDHLAILAAWRDIDTPEDYRAAQIDATSD